MGVQEVIPRGSRRWVGRALIPKLVDLEWSRTKALDYLKKQGVGYRKQIFLRDWAQISGVKQKRDRLKFVRKGYKATASVIQQTFKAQRNRYQHVYKAKTRDIESGQTDTFFLTVGIDIPLELGKIDQMAEVMAKSYLYTDSPKKYEYPTNYEFVKVERESILEGIPTGNMPEMGIFRRK